MRADRGRAAARVAALALLAAAAACGADGRLEPKQRAVVELVEAAAADAGATVDRSCVEAVLARLADADAHRILDVGLGGDADLSDEAEELLAEVDGCSSTPGLAENP